MQLKKLIKVTLASLSLCSTISCSFSKPKTDFELYKGNIFGIQRNDHLIKCGDPLLNNYVCMSIDDFEKLLLLHKKCLLWRNGSGE